MNSIDDTALAELLTHERPRLLRLCTSLCRDPLIAEDLTQETLTIAWDKRDRLRAPAGAGAWLAAIARNRWRHHRRTEYREQRRLVLLAPDLADPPDIARIAAERELEQQLCRALDALPPTTRDALIARYLHGRSVTELAAAQAISENAASVRLHRGRAALRHALTAQQRTLTAQTSWEQTTIWCPYCGAHRLQGRNVPGPPAIVQLICPACTNPHGPFMIRTHRQPHWPQQDNYQTLITTIAGWIDQRLRGEPATRIRRCTRCGRDALVTPSVSDDDPPTPTLRITCGCGDYGYAYLTELALFHPVGLAFWQRYHRLRCELVAPGDQGWCDVTFCAVGAAQRLTMRIAVDSGAVLSIAKVGT
jgi:RNA polymerase sigma factor (sigma-70 family)